MDSAGLLSFVVAPPSLLAHSLKFKAQLL